jgi:antitoxin (DNA-binding transcriptional repressor) of toxin-antitoxin stability system
MAARISATDLARRLGDILGRVRYRAETFVVERNGEAVARLSPLPSRVAGSVRDALRAWRPPGPADGSFADDLERVNAADRVPRNPWGS